MIRVIILNNYLEAGDCDHSHIENKIYLCRILFLVADLAIGIPNIHM